MKQRLVRYAVLMLALAMSGAALAQEKKPAPPPKKAGQKTAKAVKKAPPLNLLFKGKSDAAAVKALTDEIMKKAGPYDDWQRISVARILYLSGDKEAGQAIIDKVGAKDSDPDDWILVGRTYVEAKEWDKAKTAFDKALELAKGDSDYLSEVGAYYLLNGEKEKGLALLNEAFAGPKADLDNLVNAAAGFAGVMP